MIRSVRPAAYIRFAIHALDRFHRRPGFVELAGDRQLNRIVDWLNDNSTAA